MQMMLESKAILGFHDVGELLTECELSEGGSVKSWNMDTAFTSDMIGVFLENVFTTGNQNVMRVLRSHTALPHVV